MNGFGKEEQICLQKLSERLIDKGCNVLLSNSSTNFIKDLYSDKQYYSIIEVAATRHINSVGTGRGKINEVIIFSKYDVK
jgi:DNA adenine methylase